MTSKERADADLRRDQLTRAPKSDEADASPRVEVSDGADGVTRVDVADTAAVRPGKPARP